MQASSKMLPETARMSISLHRRRRTSSCTCVPDLCWQVERRIRAAVSSKINGYEDTLCPLVAEACIDVCPKNPVNFNVDNVSSSLQVRGHSNAKDPSNSTLPWPACSTINTLLVLQCIRITVWSMPYPQQNPHS